jgi:hypothetical protein
MNKIISKKRILNENEELLKKKIRWEVNKVEKVTKWKWSNLFKIINK